MLESDPRPLSEKFADVARELDGDENEEAFTAVVRKVGTAPRGPRPKEEPKG
jgi:hypothetical protein